MHNGCEHKSKIDYDTLIVKKVNFVGLICHTINVAMRLKQKSDRIKAIVEAAGKFLDMRNIKADQVHTLLTEIGSGEFTQTED